MAEHLKWSDLQVILSIGRAGSLSGAAKLLGQNHSTVFRRIEAIESNTGVRFFERHASGWTNAGANKETQQRAKAMGAAV